MRRALTTALVGLAAVLLVAGMVVVWADDLLLSPSHWETTSARLLANPTIRTSTATYLADQVDARLHLSQLLGSGLGSVPGPLAGSSVAAVRAMIFHAMDTALGLSAVRALWAQANRAAATAVVTIVDGRRGPLTVAGEATEVAAKPASVDVRAGPLAKARPRCPACRKPASGWLHRTLDVASGAPSASEAKGISHTNVNCAVVTPVAAAGRRVGVGSGRAVAGA